MSIFEPSGASNGIPAFYLETQVDSPTEDERMLVQQLQAIDPVAARLTLQDTWFWGQVMNTATCDEADALGCLLISLGADPHAVARLVIEGHGVDDDEGEGDRHFHGPH